jgi:hypothetical protein
MPKLLKMGVEGAVEGAKWLGRKASQYTLPYRSSYREGKTGARYDPRYFDIEEDPLIDDAGEVIARKDRLKPKEGTELWLPQEKEPGTLWRGMSADEYEDIQKTGRIQSRGDYNFESQQGLTYFDVDPATAQSYSSAYAPAKHKPNFDKPAYVVGIKEPSPERFRGVPGTSEGERGIEGEIPADDITKVWRGNVVEHTPEYKSASGNVSVSSSARLHWEAIDFVRKYGIAAAIAAGVISNDHADAAEQQATLADRMMGWQ